MSDQSQLLKAEFMRWQCRVRQMAMRDNAGRPDDGSMPVLTLSGGQEPMGSIITLLSKNEAHSQVPEMRHMFKQTFDPVKQREKALQFFSEVYYQKSDQFSDVLTSTFAPDSPGALAILENGKCVLRFELYNQCYNVVCQVSRLDKEDYLYQATWWHNLLFNPNLHPETIIMAFSPDWRASSSGEAI